MSVPVPAVPIVPTPETSPLQALLELALRDTRASAAFVFDRLKDGSYVLEGGTEALSPAALQAFHAALPSLERDLARDGGSWIRGDRRPRSRARGRLAAFEQHGHAIAFAGFVEEGDEVLGALVLTGAAAIAREAGERLTTALLPVLSVKGSAREQSDLAGRLKLRVYRLHTIFDLSRELSATLNAGHILRSLTTTLMGQLMVSQATVLRPHGAGPEARVRVHHFPRGADAAARRSIQRLPWSSIVQAARRSRVRRNGPAGEALSGAGLARLYPMEVGGEVVGVVAVSRKSSGSALSSEDDEFAKTLTNHAAIALSNARLLKDTVERQRIERELAFAQTIQRAILPQAPVSRASVTVWGETVPCFEVGGDYFDVIELPEGRLLVAVGDVSGKGVPAALLMASVAATMRALAHAQPPLRAGELARLVSQANDLVGRTTAKSRFVSLLLLTVDTERGTFRYVNAGHNPGLLVTRRGEARLHEGGMPLGLFPSQSYAEEELVLRPDEAILLFTDGISERWEDDTGEATLATWVREALARPAPEILSRLRAKLGPPKGGANPLDDMTLVAISRRA
ncbi:MAG: PP2C family protein-serine/threonine phosphatase [Acidobacteriota bacterium]